MLAWQHCICHAANAANCKPGWYLRGWDASLGAVSVAVARISLSSTFCGVFSSVARIAIADLRPGAVWPRALL